MTQTCQSDRKRERAWFQKRNKRSARNWINIQKKNPISNRSACPGECFGTFFLDLVCDVFTMEGYFEKCKDTKVVAKEWNRKVATEWKTQVLLFFFLASPFEMLSQIPVNTPWHSILTLGHLAAAHCNTMMRLPSIILKDHFLLTSWLYANALQPTATHYNTLQHTSTQWCTSKASPPRTPLYVLYIRSMPTRCNTLQHTATQCNKTMRLSSIDPTNLTLFSNVYSILALLQYAANHYKTLPFTATHYNKMMSLPSIIPKDFIVYTLYWLDANARLKTATHWHTLQQNDAPPKHCSKGHEFIYSILARSPMQEDDAAMYI